MKQIRPFGDERTLSFCAFCAGKPDTRDHCPSRVFLDKPYPENLPVVGACSNCNAGFSDDEEYLACFISCAIAGSIDPEMISREKISRILDRKPALQARIEKSGNMVEGKMIFSPDRSRVANVVTKLAQGHILFELHEVMPSPPNEISFTPASTMSDDQRVAFERLELPTVLPEIGSRMMQRIFEGTDLVNNGWLHVQDGRYRYAATVGNGLEVRIVIHDYLYCRVRWEL